ncbi:hypothetical protein EJV47_21025 [Hymenobacter gummosus]|uniref:Uncharacterized protein n=1 Tax=Hymenobacter gummosus TaxID=1776032 RepID=A0A3S0JBU3_9BACT|nr:hypothetical protein [Hymenobacter gummosus]RTQ46856.1 hypothetical protein EJV47_21025 [Hymenobacter gummosus]
MNSFHRRILSASLLLTLSGAAYAQTPDAPAATPAAAAPAAPAPAAALLKPDQVTGEHYKTYLYKRYAADEQATKAIRLFARRQTGGAVWLGTGAGVIGFVASQTGTKTDPSGGTTTVTVTPVGWAVLLGLFGGVGIGKLARFSNEKLYLALAAYEKDHAFPHYVARRID